MIGRQISHFYIIRTLGTGGMGVVYEAQDTRLPRSVAIKVLKEDLSKDRGAVRRFKREARLASSLNHPNICTILEVNDDESQLFIAMELLDGVSLKARLLAGRMPLGQILDVAIQAADALGASHAQNIVHRDITPGNIFLVAGGIVKLLDFGLAKHFPAACGDEQMTDDLTSVGVVPGTIHYMSPEQLSGAVVDYRCDFFALGAVMYQMATGARPFDIQPRKALSSAIRNEPHLPLSQLAPDHPPALGRIVDRLLAKRPDERYQSAGVLRADLESLRHITAAGGSAALPRAGAASLAVLPFDVVGTPAAHALALRDGVAADLSSRLSRVKDLWVAPRTSTMPLAGQSMRDIGRRLGVEMVVEGTVQQTAERVRVTASLVDAAQERAVLPSIVIERVVTDLLTTQDDIARELCDGLARGLVPAPSRPSSQDPEAYHAFKRGQHLWKSCFEGGWRPAIDHFQHAIDRDPRFALAHAALASAYNFLGYYCLVKPTLAFATAGRAAERALAIDPSLGAACIEAAVARLGGDWDWDGAEQAFRRGLALDDLSATGHVYYSWLLMLLGRADAALAEAARGQALAPASRFVAAARAQTLFLGGRYAEGIELCDQCLRFDAGYVFAMHLRGLCHLATAVPDRAVADLERAATLGRRAPFYLGLLGRCYGEFGMREQALGLIAELDRQPPDVYVPPQSYVYIYAGLGERDRAIAYQEKAYEDGASPFNYLFPGVRELYARYPDHKRRLEQMRLTI